MTYDRLCYLLHDQIRFLPEASYRESGGYVNRQLNTLKGLPEDLDDPSRYISVPHKNDLDLGRRLAIRYIDEALPRHASTIREIFRKKGAYAKFKTLLDQERHLDKWYSYESKAVEKALRAWAEENGIHVLL